MPQISLPEIKLPDIRFRDGQLRDMKLPDIDLRDRLPDVDLSRLSLPGPLRDISMPEVRDVHLPDVHLPDVHLPDVHLPDVRGVKVSDLKAPSIDMPDVDLRSLDPRRLDLSGLDAKRLRALAPFVKPAPKPASPLLWALVAGIAGLSAGWFLATSPMTAPTIRTIGERVRARIDAWRAARSEWDDSDERSEGHWSSDDGSMQSGWTTAGGDAGGSDAAAGTDEHGTDDSRSWSHSAETAAMGGTGYEPSGAGYDSGANREG